MLVYDDDESSRVALKDTPNWHPDPSHDIESQSADFYKSSNFVHNHKVQKVDELANLDDH